MRIDRTSGTLLSAQSNQSLLLYGLGNTTQNSSTNMDARSVSFNGLGGVTVGYSSGSIQISGANAPGTLSEFSPYPVTSALSNSALGQNSIYFVPFDVDEHVSAYRMNVFLSIATTFSASNATGSAAFTMSGAIYTRGTGTASGQINSLWSGSYFVGFSNSSNTALSMSHPIGISNSTAVSQTTFNSANANISSYLANSVAGFRAVPIPVSLTLSPGRYWAAFAGSSTSANASFVVAASVMQQTLGNHVAFQPFGTSSGASNASNQNFYPGMGTYSATSGGFPSSVPITSDSIRGAPTMTIPIFNFSAYTTNTNQL
jgi:hypothetical protein